jgi:ATP-dependent exoDNAse (exonuclease V) alpha subunit
LDIGQGRHTTAEGFVELSPSFQLPDNSLPTLINHIYPGIDQHPLPGSQYFSSRAILSSRNTDVDEINQDILNNFPGEELVFHSADSVLNNNPDSAQGELMYPVEYLNSINCSGLPLAKLKIKIGCPVMVLRNINAGEGLCNGSRGIVTQVGQHVIQIRLITGDHAGSVIFVPRLNLCPSDTQVPFEFERRQFPLRLCFAMTINKAQGQSVQHVGLDLRTPVFTHGQYYVAVSRVTSVYNIKAIWNPDVDKPVTTNIVYPEVLLN